jgi:hypothetical protein
MTNLIEEAKRDDSIIRKNYPFIVDDDIIDLIIAWAKDEISLASCSRTISKHTHHYLGGAAPYCLIARAFKEGIKRGKIIISN